MSNITVFGISNCDQVRKARKWLEASAVDFTFHDFRKDGLTEEQVQQWVDSLGWEKVINKRSTAWRNIDEEARNNMDADTAVKAAVATPTLVKRPLLAVDDHYIAGFNDQLWQQAINNS